MTSILKPLVSFILKYLAKIAIWRFSPRIIAIAGTEGKSEIREAIMAKLLESGTLRVRENSRGFNTEIGLPLAILDEPTGKRDTGKWISILSSAFKKVFLAKSFPEVLVLELGVDSVGEMQRLLDIVHPDISVLYCIRPRGFGDEEFLSIMEQEFRLLVTNSFRFLANAHDERIARQSSLFCPPGKLIPFQNPHHIAEEVEVVLGEILGTMPKG
ncbi:MAG: hypothetical protein WCJ84_01185 [Candidatus Peregrinibacteria bacterium]